nr:DDX20 [Scylla paramamosain]
MEQVAHHLEEKERTRDIEIDENVTFTDLLLSEPVLAGLHAAGFKRPSPIQLAAIPLGRCGLDLVVQAKSGTGKTCVLAVVALEAVSVASPATQVVVVAPTREVAVQVAQVVSTLASAMPGLSTAVVIGGTKLADDKARLQQCQVVVGTPGRLAHLVSLGHLHLHCVRLLVLDEADRLLEGNFLGPVTDLASALPLNKQVLCLSATFSDSAAAQAEGLMRSPSHVRLDRDSPALLGVNQVVCRLQHVASPHLRQAAKEAELLRLLSHVTFNQCLVFSGSQLRAESVCHRLKAEGWPSAYLTGAQCQTERLAALESLQTHRCRILVATDLAARGLDSAHVNLVVSLDLPQEPATYLHRAGRAGRYGSRGAAVMLVCGPEEWYGARAIATLANVRLLLAGKHWVNHLAMKKVEGWKWPEGGKEEKVRMEESDEGKTGSIEKQEEEGVDKSQEGRIGVEGSNEGKEEEVTRLREVDHLDEEEAHAWLKTHKPYRKESVPATPQQENGEVQSKNNNKFVNGDVNPPVSEAKCETITETQRDHEVKKKVRRKERDHNQEEEEEEKENRGNMKRHNTSTQTNTHKNTQKSPQKHREKQEMNTDTQKKHNTETDFNTKGTVMSLVSRVWHRPPPVTMSYAHLLSECTTHHNTSTPTSDTQVKVPPWPVQVEATESEVFALEKYLDGQREEAQERKEAWSGVRFDAFAVLDAMTQGRNAREVLEEEIQRSTHAFPHTPVSPTPSTGSIHSSPSTSQHSSHSQPKNHKSKQSQKSSSSEDSSSSSDSELPTTGQKQVSSPPQRHVSSPPHPTQHTKHLSAMHSQAPQPQREQPVHNTTGTRPKERKQRKTQSRESKNEAESKPMHYQSYHDNYNYSGYNNNYNYNQGYPGYDQNQQYYYNQYADHNTYNGYNQGYYDYNQGHSYHESTQLPTHTHTGYTQGMDAYIRSACKFASMMEYVSNMGRVSLYVSQDYHNRRQQWGEQTGGEGTTRHGWGCHSAGEQGRGERRHKQ